MQEVRRRYGLTVSRNKEEKTISVCEYNDSVVAEVPMPVIITDEDIDDILVSAFSGGINYWCYVTEIIGEPLGDCSSEHVSHGGSITMHDKVSDVDFVLGKDKMINGIIRYINHPSSCDILEVQNHQLVLDTGYVDAEVADSIVQYALFGDIMYA